MQSEAVAVLFDDSDVAAGLPHAAAAFLTLTPSARLAADRKGLAPVSSGDRYSDWGHARTVAAARKALREFDGSTAVRELPMSIRLMGRQSAWQLAMISSRLVLTLPKQPCLLRGLDASWREVQSREQKIEVLLPRIVEAGLAHRLKSGRPPFSPFYSMLTEFVARRGARRSRVIAAPNGKLKLGMGQAVRNAGFDLVAIAMTRGGLQDYAQLLRALVGRSSELGIVPVEKDDLRLEEVMGLLHRTGNSFSDSTLRTAWRLYLPYLQLNASGMLAVLDEGVSVLDRLKAAGVIGYEANSWLSAALLEAAQRTGAISIIANHNSHPRSGSAIANCMLQTLRTQRIDNELVQQAVEWSPEWKAWQDDRSDQGRQHFPYRLPYPSARRVRQGPFRILHASNYQNWSEFMPWIAQTSDEYVDSIAALASVVAAHPDMELTIRVRSKREVDAHVVREFIPSAPNISVTGSERDFLEEMADRDLLVSHFSTTAEQALQMAKPVLLWGSATRYCQFTPSWSPPGPHARGSVFAVRNANRLADMLRAIRDHYRNRPLSDADVSQYRNHPEAPDVGCVVARLFAN